MSYTEITALWTGFSGSPGYTKIKFNADLTAAEAQVAASRLRVFFDALKAYIPAEVTLSFASTAQIFDYQQQLIGEVPISPSPNPVVGAATGAYLAGAGACIRWLTNGFSNGRKVTGKTFLVPLAPVAFEANGTLSGGAAVGLLSAATALANGSPSLAVTSHRGDTYGVYNVLGAQVPDRSAILRSRRD